MDLVTPGLGLIIITVLSLLALLLPLLALISIVKNKFKYNDKLIWVLIVLLLPFLGTILYFVIGRGKRLKPLV